MKQALLRKKLNLNSKMDLEGNNPSYKLKKNDKDNEDN